MDSWLSNLEDFESRRGFGVEFESLVMTYNATDMPYVSVDRVEAGWPLRCVTAQRYSMMGG